MIPAAPAQARCRRPNSLDALWTSWVRRKILALKGRGERPFPGAWLVIAKVAEKLGLRDDAISAYRRIPQPADGRVTASAEFGMAKQRLVALGATKQAPPSK